MLTGKTKKWHENAHLHQLALKGVKRTWIVFVTFMVHKLKNILKILHLAAEIINGSLEEKRENSFLFKFKLPVSLRSLYILPSSQPLQSDPLTRGWETENGNWKTNDEKFCQDYAYSLSWIHLSNIKSDSHKMKQLENMNLIMTTFGMTMMIILRMTK